MEASGLHSNGYSLVRHVLLGQTGRRWLRWTAHIDELGRTLGEELLEPTRIYAKACLDLADRTRTHAMSHVTGGGLAANLERVLPVELSATLDRRPGPRSRSSTSSAASATCPSPTSRRPSTAASAWSRCTDPDDVDAAIAVLAEHGVRAWVAGEVPPATEPRRVPSSWSVSTPAGDIRSRFDPESHEPMCGNSRAAGSVGLTRTL